MKKMKVFIILGFIAVMIFIVGASFVSVKVNAQEPETAEVVEQPTTEQPVVENKTDEVKEWVDKWFAPEKVATYFSYLLYLGTIIGLVANIKKLKQSNNLTLKNVSDDVKGILETNIKSCVNEGMEKYLPMIVASQEKSNEIMSIFAKILTLTQENTPESKVAILDLIQQLGVVNNELVDLVKQFVVDTQKAIEEKQEKVGKELDEIIEKYDGTSI